MIDRRKFYRGARALGQGLATAVRYVEKEGPRLLRGAGESLHLVKPRRHLAPVGIALGVLGTAAALGLLASIGGVPGRTR